LYKAVFCISIITHSLPNLSMVPERFTPSVRLTPAFQSYYFNGPFA
jgi:hypothetical protein